MNLKKELNEYVQFFNLLILKVLKSGGESDLYSNTLDYAVKHFDRINFIDIFKHAKDDTEKVDLLVNLKRIIVQNNLRSII